VKKTTFMPFKWVKCYFKVINFLKIQKVSTKTLNLIPFEGFSQVSRFPLHFWNMSEVVYEKNGLLLLFNVIFFTF
jgi:hypothetical protein